MLNPNFNRRLALQSLATGIVLATSKYSFAEELTKTVAMTEGPFYPDHLPLDTDNDLLVVNDAITSAIGDVTHLTGRLLSQSGSPLRNALVEIWQVDHNGAYLHSGTNNADKKDKNFQGYGRFLTDSKGQYYFRTVKPVPYPGRTPHIHFAISKNGHRVLTTQMLIKDEPGNEKDGVFRSIRDAKSRESVLVAFNPMVDSKIGELNANFDIVFGETAFEDDAGKMRSPRG